jgi:hypothetical protein
MEYKGVEYTVVQMAGGNGKSGLMTARINPV